LEKFADRYENIVLKEATRNVLLKSEENIIRSLCLWWPPKYGREEEFCYTIL